MHSSENSDFILFGSPWGYGSLVPQWGHERHRCRKEEHHRSHTNTHQTMRRRNGRLGWLSGRNGRKPHRCKFRCASGPKKKLCHAVEERATWVDVKTMACDACDVSPADNLIVLVVNIVEGNKVMRGLVPTRVIEHCDWAHSW